MNDALMYSVFFEAQMHSDRNEPIGKIIGLSDPDIFPAKNDQDAVKQAHNRAEVLEHLKSLRITNKESHKKLLVRVRKVVAHKDGNKVVFTPRRRKNKFK